MKGRGVEGLKGATLCVLGVSVAVSGPSMFDCSRFGVGA